MTAAAANSATSDHIIVLSPVHGAFVDPAAGFFLPGQASGVPPATTVAAIFLWSALTPQ